MIKRRKPCPRRESLQLPSDIVFKIALFIRDASSFFAFLEALGPLDAFQPFLLLRHTRPRDTLWPILQLNANDDAIHLDGVAAIARYYSRVAAIDMYDLGWLSHAMHPMADIHWRGLPTTIPRGYPSLDVWFHEWAKLRLTHVDVSHRCLDQRLLQALPQLCPHLVSLTLSHAQCSVYLEGLLAFVSTSSLTALALDSIQTGRNSTPVFTPVMVDHIVHWLQAQPVTAFRFGGGHWAVNATPSKLFDAVFGCKTIEILALVNCVLPSPLMPPGLTLTMRDLVLIGCDVTETHTLELAAALVASNVHTLRVRQLDARGAKNILRTLPSTNVLHFELSDCGITDSVVADVRVSLAASRRLQSITLEDNWLTNKGAASLARAVKALSTLETINLKGNKIQTEGAKHILRHCPSACERINLSHNVIVNATELHAIATAKGVILSV
ncbi:Aste57867_13413 [Aphanomyces stellatus]|uniref:Aste57867_13413 protein n=1 Tax=Aphanomyces stellatus TaxID=120398 RepID=A0A485KYB3_9STRA|nr:hypothetical protein As57867_013363 [Aphanomyces stellatus]VFT90252.1 Aste57867_13413 [Aphanomyces stellatus]